MSRKPSHHPGERVGDWTLVEYIDSGGNGEVWRAEDAQSQTAALKILYRFGGDGYERFVREIEIVVSLDTTRLAVLPILDAQVPPTPSKGDPPWFVMPLASTVSSVLSGRPTIEKVDAVRQIAGTLAVLVDEQALHHRDLKPNNLYSYEGRFVVGDFGLAKRPDDPGLTEMGKVVGPNAYLPSEVFLGGDVDWERVDVSVLARTLWQLVAEMDAPVRGPIAVGGEYTLSRYVDDEDYVSRLDAVIASATHETPSQRPTMAGLEQALGDWLRAREARNDLHREIERLDMNASAVLRWLVAWVRRDPGFNAFMFVLDNPQAPTDIPGLNEAELAEALGELADQYAITATSEGRDHETGLPRYWSRLYPTAFGIERVEDPEILLGLGAPLLRALLTPPDLISLDRHVPSVTVGEVTLRAAEAFFLLRYMRDRGLLHFDDQPGGGGGVLLLNLAVTRSGKLWLAGRSSKPSEDEEDHLRPLAP